MPVRYEIDVPLVVVTIDRPEVGNAIDRPTARALADAFRRFDADSSLAVAVLTGAGGKFCCRPKIRSTEAAEPQFPTPMKTGVS